LSTNCLRAYQKTGDGSKGPVTSHRVVGST
jgi:hypothetical protein